MILPHFIVCGDTNIGDAIMAMGAIQYIAKDKIVYVHTANVEVERMMWTQNMREPREMQGHEIMHVVALNVGKGLTDWNRDSHLLNMYLRQADIRLDFVPQPQIDPLLFYDREAGTFESAPYSTYDYLIAPWSQDPARSWTAEGLGALVDVLDGSVGILGGPKDSQPFPTLCYEYGHPLTTVVDMMRAARKAVITVDSGMNRLAHAAGIANHVILHPDYLPEHWVTHPGAVLVREPWNADNILTATEEIARAVR